MARNMYHWNRMKKMAKREKSEQNDNEPWL